MILAHLLRIPPALLFALPLSALGQFTLPAVSPPSQGIQLDVVVNTRQGQPVLGLTQQNFTVLDSKSPRSISSFKVVSGKQEPVEVIIFIDAIDTPYAEVALMRHGVEKYLKANPTLAHPTTIAILTDQGAQVENNFSTDGISLSNDLEHHTIGLRDITRSSQWGDSDRLSIGVKTLHQLVAYASSLPGRKIILWISPGWPLLSGPGIVLTSREQQQLFGDIMYFSTQMRQSRITLYDINPIGPEQPILEANYFQNFINGVTKPEDAQYAGVSLQVLSVQTGGLTFETNSDVAGEIATSLNDADSWYEITFEPLPGDKPNKYHHIEVRVDRPGLVVRTRDGYYSNPQILAPQH
jgi:VWFA-related protein